MADAEDRDAMLHMLVHDLRAPLTGIRLYLEMLRADAEGLGRREFLEMIDEASAVTARMNEMINDVVDAGRFEAGAMTLSPVDADLLRIANEAIALVAARGRKRQVEVEAASPVAVRCDAGLIRRVVANLVGNAVDFSPDGKPVRVLIARDNGDIEVRVSDEGLAVPAALRERIFQARGQVDAVRARARHSTGMGLTFCRLAVEAHGGRIGVDSEEGRGSTFWFRLPAHAA